MKEDEQELTKEDLEQLRKEQAIIESLGRKQRKEHREDWDYSETILI